MSSPAVSVVIPCYNTAATVEETVASVCAQNFQDFEILAVDNNCTDGTIEILSRLMHDEPRLRIVHQSVQGLSAARNAGIRQARGRFIALLDADDIWDRDYLEAHTKNLADAMVGVSFSRVRFVDIAGRSTGQETHPKLSGITAADLLVANPCTSLIVARRDVFDRVGEFNENMRRAEDQEWFFRVAAAGIEIRGMDRVLASYRITPGGLSADLPAMLASHEQFLEVAARSAPGLVARHRRVARASILRYCARRAMEHGHGADAALSYLGEMLRLAPDLAVREPIQTLKAAVAVLLPSVLKWRGRSSRELGAEGL